MDETINKEPVEGEPGAVEPPAQPPSETQAAPSAVDEASLKAILEPLVQAEVERRTQSIKDKRIAKQESRISSLEDTLAQLKELKADGMSEKQAIQYMETQEFLKSQGQIPTEAPPVEEPAVQPQVAPDAILSSALNIAGLDASDADVVQIIRDNPSNLSAQVLAVEQLATSRKQEVPPSPAAALSSGGGQAIEGESLESVTEELNELYTKPVTAATRARIQELGKKQKELLPKQ